jgi:dUTPase
MNKLFALSCLSSLVMSYFIIYKIINVLSYSTDQYVLNVCSSNIHVNNYYQKWVVKHKGDSGVDVFIPYNGTLLPKSYTKIDYDAIFVITKNNKYYSYYLYARSHLSLIPLIVINSVGVIDAGYRGKLSSIIYNPNDFNITFKQGDKYVQICANDLSELKVVNNCNIQNYGTRGIDGFGSTNINKPNIIYSYDFYVILLTFIISILFNITKINQN